MTNDLLQFISVYLNELQKNPAWIPNIISIIIGMTGLYLNIKTITHNDMVKIKDKKRQFLIDCKPLINKTTPTAHEEILLKNSYTLLTGKNLDLACLIKATKLSSEYKTLNNFIMAGHLTYVRNGKIIKKPRNVILKYLTRLWLTSLFALLIGIYVATLAVLPENLIEITTSETKTSSTFIYISILTFSFWSASKIIKYLQPKIDSNVHLKELLKIN